MAVDTDRVRYWASSVAAHAAADAVPLFLAAADELDALRAFVEWVASFDGEDFDRMPSASNFAYSAACLLLPPVDAEANA